MISKIVAALMTVLLLAAVCLAADKVVSDDMIYDNVRIKLASDQIVKGGALNVDVKEGVVTLGGMVENSKQKDRAAKLAKSVKGVKQVINNLNLKLSAPGK
jgi:hyperosmotically inducible periplasmic protein